MPKLVKIAVKLGIFSLIMYISTTTVHCSVEDFQLRDGFQLDENNRWVVLSKLIPWSEFEQEYAILFDDKIGAPAKSFRLALGALLIQQILNITDRETVAQIKENPYLQYFLGLNSYEYKAPFDSSMLVYFRQRIKKEIRMSGPPLGRRPKKNVSKEEKKQAREDEKIRNRIEGEGKFGEGKRRYGLDLIKTKLKETSENKVAIGILVMNLMTLVSRVLREIFCLFLEKQLKLGVIDNYYFFILNINNSFNYISLK